LKCFDDIYDFNKSTHRGIIGELLTAIGRNYNGTTYDIEIRGSKSISGGGEVGTINKQSLSGGYYYYYY
jgi:hypothetical protein